MMSNVFEKGITLLELTVVLLVLVALAGLTIPYVSSTGQMARCQATDATLQEIKRAIMGGPSGPGYYGDLLGYYPKKTKSTAADYNLHFLLSQPTDASWGSMNKYNPKTAVGWRGPYLQGGRVPVPATNSSPHKDYNLSFIDALDPGDSATFSRKVHVKVARKDKNDTAWAETQIMDAWNRPIILQIPCEKASASATSCTLKYDYARLVSAGPGTGINPGDAKIDTKIVYDVPLPDARDRKDDRVLYLKQPDPYPAGNTPCDQL